MKADKVKKILMAAFIGVVLKRFFDPMADFIWALLSKQTNSLVDGYLNSIVTQAALGAKKDFEVIQYVFIILVIVIYAWLQSFYADLHSNGSQNERPTKKQKKITWYFMCLSAVVVCLYVLVHILSVEFDQSLNLKFKQRLTIIAPKISDQQCKEFMAAWAMMKTVKDYNALTKELTDVANSYNIKLP